jgi:hypothetical protein
MRKVPKESAVTNEPEPTEAHAVEVRLKWVGIDELDTLHANQVAVQARGDYFLLTFGQTADPILVPGDREALREIQAKGHIPIRPLVRMAVSADDMRRFNDVIGGLMKKLGGTLEAEDVES